MTLGKRPRRHLSTAYNVNHYRDKVVSTGTIYRLNSYDILIAGVRTQLFRVQSDATINRASHPERCGRSSGYLAPQVRSSKYRFFFGLREGRNQHFSRIREALIPFLGELSRTRDALDCLTKISGVGMYGPELSGMYGPEFLMFWI